MTLFILIYQAKPLPAKVLADRARQLTSARAGCRLGSLDYPAQTVRGSGRKVAWERLQESSLKDAGMGLCLADPWTQSAS